MKVLTKYDIDTTLDCAVAFEPLNLLNFFEFKVSNPTMLRILGK